MSPEDEEDQHEAIPLKQLLEDNPQYVPQSFFRHSAVEEDILDANFSYHEIDELWREHEMEKQFTREGRYSTHYDKRSEASSLKWEKLKQKYSKLAKGASFNSVLEQFDRFFYSQSRLGTRFVYFANPLVVEEFTAMVEELSRELNPYDRRVFQKYIGEIQPILRINTHRIWEYVLGVDEYYET